MKTEEQREAKKMRVRIWWGAQRMVGGRERRRPEGEKKGPDGERGRQWGGGRIEGPDGGKRGEGMGRRDQGRGGPHMYVSAEGGRWAIQVRLSDGSWGAC